MNKNSEEYVRLRSVAALERVIEIIGTRGKLAPLLDVAESVVANWLYRTKCGVAPMYVLPLEQVSGGQVSRHQLRCDIYPEGDSYFRRLYIFMDEILDDLNIKNESDFINNLLKILPRITNVIYKDHTQNDDIWAADVLTYTAHRKAIEYAIFQPEYYEFPSHYDARMKRAFFAMQADLIDTLHTLLGNKND